ncbi:rhodanese-like domain-containing protein [Pseudodesulfovibrio sediminis]|uniref:Rhodanese domain-containing protein n=1 Tax=Pseudodesulfovibrio sediminis TaxID=2810563 RepID=A0ABM7P731_9BACT|nr:rhodanese-like domain-containing protein [Pseudodesulfovibrio sediminis]BCS88767.1 hypothetical protein PSDVSF_20090 [Pseudodesulfovibrio sediminis]
MRGLRFVLFLLFILVAWDLGWWYVAGVPPMAPWSLKAVREQGAGPVIIDVRSPAEYAYFHIPGAVNVPYPATLAELAMVSPDPLKPVVVVCMTGHRSPPVARQLMQGGYTDVHNLTWGMLAWKLFGGESVSGQ